MFRSLILTGSLLVVASGLIRAQTVSVVSGAMVEQGSATLPPAPVVLTYAEEMPVFTGGDEAFYRYLKAKIHCPAEAEHLNLSGTVYVRFVVDEEGRIRDAQVIKGCGHGLDEEALRLVRLMPWWTPGREQGKPVRVQRTMSISFRLR